MLSVKWFKYFVILFIKIDNEMKNINFVFGYLVKIVSFYVIDIVLIRCVID